MKRLQINVAAVCMAVAMGVMLSGCALVSLNKAMSDSPDAAAAVAQIESGAFLEQVAREAQREDARIAATSKMNGEWPLCCIVMDEKQTKGVRLAAFERLVKLGNAETLLGERSDLANTIVQAQSATEDAEEQDTVEALAGQSGRSMSGPRGAAISKKAGKTWAFPEEWRVKAANTGNCSGIYLEGILLDETESMSMRIAVAQAECFNLSDENIIQLINGVAKDDGRKSLVEALFARGSLSDNMLRWESLPFEDCQYVFSLLSKDKDANKLAETLHSIVYCAENAENDSDAKRFAKWAIANAGSSSVLGDFVRGGSSKKYAPWHIEAVKHIDDDAELEKILTGSDSFVSDMPTVAFAVVQQFKSPEMKAKYGAPTIAKSAPDAATRAKALADVFAQDRGAAYKIVFFWFNHEHYDGALKGADILSNLTDTKIFAGILAEAKKDDRRFADETVIPGIKLAMFRVQESKFNALPAEKVNALAASVKARAEKLNGEGKTLVVGNYYIGMPLIGLFALEKTQEVKVTAQECDLDSEGKNVIVTKMGFDAKDVYAATGIENGDLAYLKIAKKLGLSDFKTVVTKIRRNRSQMNQISEYFGDYSNSFNGGEIYRESTNHAKGVLVTYWDKSGLMEIEALAE